MSSTDVLDLFRALVRAPGAFFWAAAAWLLDRLRHLEALEAGLLMAGLTAVAAGLAWGLQKRLNGAVETAAIEREEAAREGKSSEEPATLRFRDLLRLELSHSPLFLPFKPIQLLVRAVRATGRGIAWLWRKVRRKGEPSEREETRPEPSRLVASLGPSLLLAGAVTLGLYLMALAVDPFLAARWQLSDGLSAWQYLAFGHRPELAWYLPLDRFPYLAAILAALFWLGVWSITAILLRLIRWRQLGSNLHGRREDPETLPFWRRWAGARELWRPAPPYLTWARWPVLAAVPLFAWGWLSLSGDPYRLPPGAFAVGLVLWCAWGLHLVLRGVDAGEERTDETEAEVERLPGWEDVCEHLEARFQIRTPEPFPKVAALPLGPAASDRCGRRSEAGDDGGLLSPLLQELLGWIHGKGPKDEESERLRPPLTGMQREVLETLALQGYIHTDPPAGGGRLTLGGAEQDAVQDRSGIRSRNQVILAPEGSGKTTLALLAVANHALVHTRSSLVITSTPGRAERLYRGFQEAIEPSTLRWNLRMRRPGSDLMTDLSRGILPDVVVTGLHDLVTTLLDRAEPFADFLRTLGLIVVDDVESFAGPPEVHAQLAFRRLILRVEELTGTEELGGHDLASPQVLVLGTESMHETSEWAQSLCGIDAVTRFYDRSRNGDSPVGSPAVHHVYRLRDLRRETGELLPLEELVAACEQVGVPWHYRRCGDGGRDLGRGPLLLEEEPRHAVDAPSEACVLLLEGTWSEVRRERERLARAGLGFAARRRAAGAAAPEPIAVITVAESDLEMAFTQLDRRFVLAPALQALPRPVLRPPTGRAVQPHLAAELTQHWTEVEDVVRIFGAPSARTLKHLGREHLLLAEERRDVAPKASRYVRRVYVQALSRSIEAPEQGPASPVAEAVLPPKVAQVELVSPEAVTIRDRTSLLSLGRTDAAGADFVYYPGRIFEDARGRFVVVGRAGQESGTTTPEPRSPAHSDVLVEPILTDSLSSPRRRLSVEVLAGDGEEEAHPELLQAAGGTFFGPEETLLGRHPIAVGLKPVRVALEHVATYRLGPVHCEVRQRSLLDSKSRARTGVEPLETVALAILPNPSVETREDTPEAPALGLAGARLLAATMRAVLPSVYRGAAASVAVALHLDREGDPNGGADATERAGDALGPAEGFFLFDTDAGGNGTARAIYRDGVDLLLRLCRLVLERVLPLGRIRALHDEWGVRKQILTEAGAEQAEGEDIASIAERRREEDRELREAVLAWLDSRLQPEGGAEAQHELERHFKSGDEEGGHLIDLGRCWYSRNGAATDLLWVKHRWNRPGEGEAMLDIGFDRETATRARRMREAGLEPFADDYEARFEARNNRLDGARHWGKPTPVQVLEPGATSPRAASVDAGTSVVIDLHVRLWSLAIDARPTLGNLAARLREAVARSSKPAPLTEYLCRFVQGIPNATEKEKGEAPAPVPYPPVWTLLERLGNDSSQALLLAVLLERCGLPAGLFVSMEEGRVLGALAESAASEANTRGEAARLPPFLGELPAQRSVPGSEPVSFLPVDTGHYYRPGEVVVRNPESWVFLPLVHLPELPDDPSTGAGGDDV